MLTGMLNSIYCHLSMRRHMFKMKRTTTFIDLFHLVQVVSEPFIDIG